MPGFRHRGNLSGVAKRTDAGNVVGKRHLIVRPHERGTMVDLGLVARGDAYLAGVARAMEAAFAASTTNGHIDFLAAAEHFLGTMEGNQKPSLIAASVAPSQLASVKPRVRRSPALLAALASRLERSLEKAATSIGNVDMVTAAAHLTAAMRSPN